MRFCYEKVTCNIIVSSAPTPFENRLKSCEGPRIRSRPRFAPLAPRAARVAHEQQFGALHAVSVVVALRDDVAGVGEAEADMVADADELPQYAVVADT